MTEMYWTGPDGASKLCSYCGCPMKPKGVKKKPDHYDHASGCRYDRTKVPVKHGVNCKKEPHTKTGYLHSAEDDGLYDVDGVKYCGRCHGYAE